MGRWREWCNSLFSPVLAISQFYPWPRNLLFFPEEKNILAKWSRNRKRLVEIGVFEGASASIIRKHMHPQGVLHLIDPFVSDSMNSKIRGRPLFAKINVHRVPRGRVIWHREYSFTVGKYWKGMIDFLFIDGDHSESSVAIDWVFWHKFVVPRGVVLFHDARKGRFRNKYTDGGYEGPTKLVNIFFREVHNLQWKIVDESGTIVVVQKR